MSILIKGMDMPTSCADCKLRMAVGCCGNLPHNTRMPNCPIVPVPPHGRLIDADVLRARMYHEAFETDTDMQRWESGCWIRYKMFERTEEAAPTIIPAEEG